MKKYLVYFTSSNTEKNIIVFANSEQEARKIFGNSLKSSKFRENNVLIDHITLKRKATVTKVVEI